MAKTPDEKTGLITTKCPHCGRLIDCPTRFDGKSAKCPGCSKRFKVSVFRPESPSKQKVKAMVVSARDDGVNQNRSMCGLGIASIALGVIACATCWVPILGGLAIPAALIGIFFGVAGGVVAMTTRRTDGYLAGCGVFVCLTAIGVFIFAQAWFAAELQKVTASVEPDATAWHGSDIWATAEVIDGEIYVTNQNSYAWSDVCITINDDFQYKTTMIPGREISKIPVYRFNNDEGAALSLADYEDLDMLIETKTGDCWIR